VHTLLFLFGCLFLFLGVYLVSSGRGDAKKVRGRGRASVRARVSLGPGRRQER
jgi:hypothetical protein